MGEEEPSVERKRRMLGGFELFREFQLYRMLVFGFAMVLIMIWRPRGLVATREPSLTLGERKT